MYDRLYDIFSTEAIDKLNKANILLVGVGGVGSFCFETLIRSGIKNITIVDFDKYEISNLNRQMHSNQKNIGDYKVDVLQEYAKNINQDITVKIVNEFLDENSTLDIREYDYIIDAVDSVKAKEYLIVEAHKYNKKIICSMGIGNRKDTTKLAISTLNKTYNDPLAKKLRSILNKNDIDLNIKVVFSKELPIKSKKVSSYIAVTAYAGLLLADTVIKDITNE